MLWKAQGLRLDKGISTIKGGMKNKIIIGDAIRSGNIGLAQEKAIPAGSLTGRWHALCPSR